MSGDRLINNPGVSDNQPKSRTYAISWTDAAGNFWLFGGIYTTGYGYLNDLWKYSNGVWSWISGDDKPNKPGLYNGPDQENQPGARGNPAGWIDGNANLWLFGGGMRVGATEYCFNDMWKYDTIAKIWSWVNGDSVANKDGVYIKRGPDPKNRPGARIGPASWLDKSGNFWMFGGKYSASPTKTLNDLWKFTPCPAGVTGVKYGDVIVPRKIPYKLNARENIGFQYAWSPTEGLINANSATPTVNTDKDITYKITIRARNCIIVDEQKVVVAKGITENEDTAVIVPTAFTPNNNGTNDRLKPIPINLNELHYFKVFNRWGQLVFDTKVLGEGWDGNLKGKPQPTETYTWILECIIGNRTVKKSGRSVLIR
jgi:gliding motility-associated-like protein